MSSAAESFNGAAKPEAKKRAGTHVIRRGTPRDCPRVTVRLSGTDHARLVELADGMALSAYIRAAALNEVLGKRKRRSLNPVADRKAIAQVLGLLGQSRIASNLNQLAYQANIGALEMDERALAQIEEAYLHITAMRGLLLKALGSKS